MKKRTAMMPPRSTIREAQKTHGAMRSRTVEVAIRGPSWSQTTPVKVCRQVQKCGQKVEAAPQAVQFYRCTGTRQITSANSPMITREPIAPTTVVIPAQVRKREVMLSSRSHSSREEDHLWTLTHSLLINAPVTRKATHQRHQGQPLSSPGSVGRWEPVRPWQRQPQSW